MRRACRKRSLSTMRWRAAPSSRTAASVVKTTGDGIHAVFDDASARARRHIGLAASAPRFGRERRCAASRALRAASRRRRAPRRRLLWQRRQPCGADHDRGARRSDIAVAGRGRWRTRLPSGASVAARSRSRKAARPFDAGMRLPGRSSAAARGVSGAALAGDDAEQPSAAADDVHRPRQGIGGVEAPLRHGAPADTHRRGRLRQDPPGPAACRRFARALSGRRMAGRACAAFRPWPRAADRGDRARARGRTGEADHDDARRASQGQAGRCYCSTTASTCSAHARCWPSPSCGSARI